MDQTKTKDVTLRVLAILISFILWIYVTTEQNPEINVEIPNVPVKIVNTEALAKAGYIMVGNNNDTITVKVKGRSKDVLALKPEDFVAEANMGTGYKMKGNNSIPVELKDYPKNIDVPNQPFYISVELDELVQKNVPVTVQLEGKPGEGYANLAPQVKPVEVILKGAAQFIGSVNSVIARVNLKDATMDVATSLPLEILDKDGAAISNVDCIPKTVDIIVPIRKFRIVPVSIKTSGKLPDGIYLKNMTVNPQTVAITGDERIVNEIKSINTLPVPLDGISTSTTKAAKLDLPNGVVMVDNIQSVNVSVNVEGTISRIFNVPLTISGLRDDLNAELSANTISITLTGQESLVSKIDPGTFSASIDLSGVTQEGENDYTPKITGPSGFDMSYQPQKVRIKISKKQG